MQDQVAYDSRKQFNEEAGREVEPAKGLVYNHHFFYQKFSVIHHKIFIVFLSVVKVLTPIYNS